jgi:hypothetical protein
MKDSKTKGMQQADLDAMLAASKNIEDELPAPKTEKTAAVKKQKSTRRVTQPVLDKKIGIRVSDEEREIIFQKATKENLTLSDYILRRLGIKR